MFTDSSPFTKRQSIQMDRSTLFPRAAERRRGQSGQSVVEFALFAPILILLLAGAVDLGNGFQSWITLTNSAREGSHKGASTSDTSLICARVQEELANNKLTVACTDITVTYPAFTSGPNTCNGTRKTRCPIRVAVVYSMTTLLGSVLGINAISIKAFDDTAVF